jgi:biotin carboxyl carrier protein
MKLKVTVGQQSFEIEVDHDQLVWVDGRPIYASLQQLEELPVYGLTLDDAGYVVLIQDGPDGYEVEIRGSRFDAKLGLGRPALAAHQAATGSNGHRQVSVCAPLAGCLVALPVAPGERVEAEQVVAVVESMKMQMDLRAPHAGVVTATGGPVGRDVRRGEELVALTV